MPMAIPLLAAAGSMAAGAAAVGGTMAGFAAAGIGTQLVAGAMIAGGAMTAVGALTGSKKLQKYGGILSLAGGVGGLATGAWSNVASSLASEAGTAANTASETFRGLEIAAQSGSAGAAAANNAAINIGGMTGMGADSGMYDAAAQVAKAPAANQAMTNSLMASSTSPAVPVNGPSAVAPGGGASQPGMLQRAVDWAQQGNNPRLVQAGAGLLQSGLGAYGQQEAAKEQIKMQEDAAARARQRLNDSVKGIRVPVYQPARG